MTRTIVTAVSGSYVSVAVVRNALGGGSNGLVSVVLVRNAKDPFVPMRSVRGFGRYCGHQEWRGADMLLGVHLPVSGRDASPETIAQVAIEAERIGLDSVWSWERLMRPTVPIAMGGAGGPVMNAPERFGLVYDPIETLAYVAAKTSRILLGTSVLDTLFQP